ncbi:hypothetical protein MRX96_051439 [Rhipicephalus microplus]
MCHAWASLFLACFFETIRPFFVKLPQRIREGQKGPPPPPPLTSPRPVSSGGGDVELTGKPPLSSTTQPKASDPEIVALEATITAQQLQIPELMRQLQAALARLAGRAGTLYQNLIQTNPDLALTKNVASSSSSNTFPAAPHSTMADGRLLQIWEAYHAVHCRWQAQKHNHHLHLRLARLALDMEEHCSSLLRQKWGQTRPHGRQPWPPQHLVASQDAA